MGGLSAFYGIQVGILDTCEEFQFIPNMYSLQPHVTSILALVPIGRFVTVNTSVS